MSDPAGPRHSPTTTPPEAWIVYRAPACPDHPGETAPMEQDLTDALTEVRMVAADVAVDEQEIVDLEHDVAETMRGICTDLFGGTTKYRMPMQRIREIDDDGHSNDYIVWRNIGTTLVDNVTFDGSFRGEALVLRVQINGPIIAIWITVPETRCYDLHSAEGPYGTWGVPYGRIWRVATDREIAAHAPELADQVIAALKRRIDTAKDHKQTLKRVRDATVGAD